MVRCSPFDAETSARGWSGVAPPRGGAQHAARDLVGPCNDSGEPGNSDYAQHHIKPLAQEGGLGEGGHKPGTHQGYSTCHGD